MKNIWKHLLAMLSLVAMMATLVACPDNTTEEEEEGTYVASTGVYTIDVSTDKISSAWGGSSASPAFTIILLTDAQKADLATVYANAANWIKDADVSEPVYQIAADNNMTAVTVLDGTYAVAGATAKQYAGVVSTQGNGRTSITVDLSKVVITDLKMLAANAEKVLTTADSADLTGYKPYILAFIDDGVTDTTGVHTLGTTEVAYGWSASLVPMTSGATYPATVSPSPEKIAVSVEITFTDSTGKLTLTNVTVWKGLKSSINGSNFAWNGGSAVEFTANSKDEVIKVTATAGTPQWAIDQNPWTGTNTKDNPTAGKVGSYPAGTDTPAKVTFGGDALWVPFSKTTDTSFDFTKAVK